MVEWKVEDMYNDLDWNTSFDSCDPLIDLEFLKEWKTIAFAGVFECLSQIVESIQPECMGKMKQHGM